MTRPLRGAAGALVAAVLLAACGTTVAGGTVTGLTPMNPELGGPVGVGSSGPGPQAPGGGTGAGLQGSYVPGVNGTTGQPLGAPVSGQAPGTGAPAAGSATGQPQVTAGSPSGRGFTAKEIFLGFGTQDDVNQAATAAGLDGVTFGDTKAQVRAVLDYVNKRGGVLGRKLVPVFADSSTGDSPAVAAQNTCTKWTQDNKVFAVLNPVKRSSVDTLYECLKKAGTPLMRFASGNTDAEDYQRYEHYAPANISGARFVPTLLSRLKAQGYFEQWNATGRGATPPKVGLLLLPRDADLRKVLEAELRRAGYPAAEVYVTKESYDSADYQAAVLRFTSKDITHVFASGTELVYFMAPAESQTYRPRYALTTWNQPGALLQIAAPASQLAGALGVGYVPSLDVDNANDPGDVSANTTLCRQIMQENGQDTTVRLTFLVMLAQCDMVFLLRDALTQQGVLTNEALRAGVTSTKRFTSALTFQSGFSPGGWDGARVVRDLGYVTSCGCFRYGKANTPTLAGT